MSETENQKKPVDPGSLIDFKLGSSFFNELLRLEVIENQIYRANYLSKTRSTGIYGGQIISQAMAASQQTVNKEYEVHSIHSYFILSGDNTKPVVYHVENVRDGRSFSTRLVKAVQSDRHIFSCILSYHKPEESLFTYQMQMPTVPQPESLPLLEDVMKEILSNDKVTDFQRIFITKYISRELEYFIKPIGASWLEAFMDDKNENENNLMYWIKFKTTIDSNRQDVHRWLAGYISDSFLIQAASMKLPKKNFYPSMMVSLDHSLWFHTNFCVDEWMLYECNCTRYAGCRALISGRIWKRDGTLAVTIAQEGLVRIRSLL